MGVIGGCDKFVGRLKAKDDGSLGGWRGKGRQPRGGGKAQGEEFGGWMHACVFHDVVDCNWFTLSIADSVLDVNLSLDGLIILLPNVI